MKVKTLSEIKGGAVNPGITLSIGFSINPIDNWFDGSFWGNLLDGDKSTKPDLNEFDDPNGGVSVKF